MARKTTKERKGLVKRGTRAAIQRAEDLASQARDRLRVAEDLVRWAKVAYLEKTGWKHLGIRTSGGHFARTTMYYFLAERGQHYSLSEAVNVQGQRERGVARRAARKAGA